MSVEGTYTRLNPTDRGLRLKPLSQQSDELVVGLHESLEKGPDPNRTEVPELVEDPIPPANPAADEINLSIPVIGELIEYTSKVAVERKLPMAGWAFVPQGQ